MRFISILCALAVSSTAYAQKPNNQKPQKMRLKLSTPIYSVAHSIRTSDLGETTVTDSALSLLAQPARFELTYRVAKHFEFGAMISVGGIKTESEFTPATTSNTAEESENDEPNDEEQKPAQEVTSLQSDQSIFYLTGAYNFKVAKGVFGFIQPIVSISYLNDKMGDTKDDSWW